MEEETVHSLGASLSGFAPQQLAQLTKKQIGLIEKVDQLQRDPILPHPLPERAPEQIRASKNLHKRINPGFVDMAYKSSNQLDYKYLPAPDFTRDFLKAESDIGFQKYLTEAILKGVDLKKTSH